MSTRALGIAHCVNSNTIHIYLTFATQAKFLLNHRIWPNGIRSVLFKFDCLTTKALILWRTCSGSFRPSSCPVLWYFVGENLFLLNIWDFIILIRMSWEMWWVNSIFSCLWRSKQKIAWGATRHRLRVASDKEIEAKNLAAIVLVMVSDLDTHQRRQHASTYQEQLQMLLHPTFKFLNGLYWFVRSLLNMARQM